MLGDFLGLFGPLLRVLRIEKTDSGIVKFLKVLGRIIAACLFLAVLWMAIGLAGLIIQTLIGR
jgi:hypothetical protein